jgi:RNase adapter protein RapZ
MSESVAHIIVVTGMSGAGRSTAGNALEDAGWRVIDNLPSQLLPSLVDLAASDGGTMNRLAVVIDVRGGDSVEELAPMIETLRQHATVRVLFLDATDSELIKRFESVRRPHPLQGNGTLIDGIHRERERLETLRGISDVVVDTTGMNIHQTTTLVYDSFRSDDSADVNVVIESFGFKHGLPADADVVGDVRFVPNPFWTESLRDENGLHPDVSAFVLNQTDVDEYLDGLVLMLGATLRGYVRENKRHATIAIGCTGGKHRSVAIAEELARRLEQMPGVAVTRKHRDIGRT